MDDGVMAMKGVLHTAHNSRSIWPLDGTLTSTTTVGHSEPESHGNEGVLHTPQISRTGVSSSDAV